MPATADAQASLQHDVANMRWYHTLELPGGIVTPGEFDLRPIVDRLPWPLSLRGHRCLDIGSRDGFYSFEMERRGAEEVISIDIEEPKALQFPATFATTVDAIQAELDAGNQAFEVARQAYGSSVERRSLSVYDLAPETIGSFDFIVIGTLLHHLRDPVRALMATRSVTAGQLLINDAVSHGIDSFRRRPLAELLMQGGPFWWLANPAGLRRLAEAAGFTVLRSGRPYVVPFGAGGGRHRASLRWALQGPLREFPERLIKRYGNLHAWLLAEPAG